MFGRLLTSLVAIGVLIAGSVLWRIISSRRSLRRLRWCIAALTGYGALSFVYAAVFGMTVRETLSGHGLLQALPSLLQGAFIGGFVILPLGWMASVIRLGIARFRDRAPRPLWFQAVALTTCFALLVTSLETRRLDGTHLESKDRTTLLNNSMRALEDGDREMPRDTWDPAYVVGMVGRDPLQLFRWVRDNTYWIPYHGVLRGPVGVLMDRQGNSLDRALLLATLLEKAGHTVRLAHGELTQDLARDLLPRLVTDRELALHARPENPKAPKPNFQRVSVEYGVDNASLQQVLDAGQQVFAEISAELRSRVDDQSRRLLQIISRPEADTEWLQRFEDALSALRDHWWVQQEEDGKWIDLDLLQKLPEHRTAITDAQATFAPASLPTDLKHDITIRVVGEQASRGKLIQHEVLRYVLRPADAFGKSIVLQFWPLAWMSSSGTDQTPKTNFVREASGEDAWGAALAIDSHVVSSGALLASGDDGQAGPENGPMGGIAAAFARTMGLAAGEDEHRQLSAAWIEYQARLPGGQPRIARRYVFDLIGPAVRASSSPLLALDDSKKAARALAMMMRTEILPLACRLSPEFLMHLAAQTLIGNHDLINAALRGDLEPGTPRADALLRHIAPTVSRLHSLAEARIEWSRDPDSLFMSEPQLLTTHSYPVAEGDRLAFRDATDIVANNFGVSLAVPDGFHARLEQGILDTNAEAFLQLGAVSFGNAGEAYAQSRAWTRIADRSEVSGLKLPEDSRRSMAEDLSSGYDVVAPRVPIPMHREDFVGWWRIDRSTGNALGIGTNGWGSELTESPAAEHEETNTPALSATDKFNKMMRAFWEGFTTDYSFCVVLKTSQTIIQDDMVVIHQHLVATIASSPRDCGPHALMWGIVSAVFTLFIVTMGPFISKWLTRYFPWTLPVARFLAGRGRPILGGKGSPGVGSGGGGTGGGGEPGGGEPGGGAPQSSGSSRGGSGSARGGGGSGGGSSSGSSGGGGAPEGPGEPNPPKPEDPCNDIGGSGSEPSGPPTDPYPDAVQQLENNLDAARADFAQAQDEYRKAMQDFLAQKVNKPNIAAQWDPANGPSVGDPSKFDQAAFDEAQRALDQAWKNYIEKESAVWAAEQAFDNYMAKLGQQRGAGVQRGNAGGGCGQNLSSDAPQSGTGPAQQVGPSAGDGSPAQQAGPAPGNARPVTSLDPALPAPKIQVPGDSRNPFADTQPVVPPTQRSPQSPTQGAPSGSPDEAIPPTQPGRPPTGNYPAPSDTGAPPTQRSPQYNPAPPATPAQKTIVGVGGTLNALAGPK
jgi:hypothetical protein